MEPYNMERIQGMVRPRDSIFSNEGQVITLILMLNYPCLISLPFFACFCQMTCFCQMILTGVRRLQQRASQRPPQPLRSPLARRCSGLIFVVAINSTPYSISTSDCTIKKW